MKSEKQVNDWYEQVQWAHQHRGAPEMLKVDVNLDLAEHIWEAECAVIHTYRSKILRAIDSPQSLRGFLEFEAMDEALWQNLGVLLYSLVQHRDISNIDFVIGRICDFVKMCTQFNYLRFADSIANAKSVITEADLQPVEGSADTGVVFRAPGE